MTDPRRQEIIGAAFEMFMRYGYRRTTIDDIAQRVGLSRPTLYLTFPSKDAIFRAVVEDGFGRIFNEIEAGLPAQRSLTEQLLHVFEIWSIRPFELVTHSPAADELMTNSFGFASDVFNRSSEHLAALLTRLLREGVTQADELDPPAQAQAQVLIGAAHGFKSRARDTKDIRQLIRDLVALTVAGFPPPATTIPHGPADTRPMATP